MSNIWDDMREAVIQSRATFKAADNVAHDMANLLRGRLKHVDVWVLVELKRELTKFDAHKKEWKE